MALTNLDLDTVKTVLSEYRMHNADVHLRYDATVDDLIDVIEGSRVYIPCVYAVNKIDQITLEELEVLDKLPHYCPIRCVVRQGEPFLFAAPPPSGSSWSMALKTWIPASPNREASVLHKDKAFVSNALSHDTGAL